VKKTAFLLLLSAVVSILVWKVSIAPVLANLRPNRLIEARKKERPKSFSSLQPYTYIRIDAMPRRPWVTTDFRFGWVNPEALSKTALNSFFLPQIYGFGEAERKRQPRLDLDLDSPWIGDLDDTFLASGKDFTPYPYSLVAMNEDGSGRSAFPGTPGWAPAPGGAPVADQRAVALAPGDVTAVPEPATTGLLAVLSAAAALLWRRRVIQPAAELK
jgi:hypothetical protein